MPDQAGLTFDPTAEGIWSRMITHDMINHGQWLRAVAERSFVGTCRACGAHMRPLAPEQHGVVIWYEAECTSCGKIVAAPCTPSRNQDGGRILRRSSAHSHMPRGWIEHRNRTLKAKSTGASEEDDR